MRTIAYINWVFFLIVFSAIGFGIDGIDKSYDNNYFGAKLQMEKEDAYFFPKSAKVLGTILDDEVEIDNFPFKLFTHIIVDENIHLDTFYNYHKILIREKEKLDLNNKELLLNIVLEHAINPLSENTLFDLAYEILDSLHIHFPNSTRGLVFELDATKSKAEIENDLKKLSQKIVTNNNVKNYLCLNYSRPSKRYEIDFLKNENLLPKNYGGQFIKTFNSRSEDKEMPLSNFDRINTLLDTFLTTPNIDIQKTIFCFPTYPLILEKYEKSRVVGLEEVPGDFKHKNEGKDKNLFQYSKNNGQDTIFFNNYKYLEKIDTTFISNSKIKMRLDTSTTGVIDTIRDTTYFSRPKYETTTFAFEDQETLESKIEFAIQKGINIGFWNYSSIIHQDKSVSISGNPIDSLLKFAKSNFVKKVAKKPGDIKEIVMNPVFYKGQNDQSDWTEPSTWYWQTLEKHIQGPKTPDYLLFLLVPLFVFKFLMPSFILGYFTVVNPYSGDHFLKPLKVNLFNISVSAYTFLILDILFWFILFILFMRSWYTEDIGYTTRNFSILILLIAVLGRPIVKFIIRLFKLFGKPLKIRKVIKLLPYLGEMIYYYLTKEEREIAVKHIKGVDRDRNVFADIKQPENDKSEENKENEDYIRLKGYFSGKKYSEIRKDQDKSTLEISGEMVDKKGKGFMNIPKWFVILFQSLFVGFSIFLVWYFEFNKFGGFTKENLNANYILIFIIFFIEVIIITYCFFKEYYIFYLTKLLARNV